jgi:hypothetical protein
MQVSSVEYIKCTITTEWRDNDNNRSQSKPIHVTFIMFPFKILTHKLHNFRHGKPKLHHCSAQYIDIYRRYDSMDNNN